MSHRFLVLIPLFLLLLAFVLPLSSGESSGPAIGDGETVFYLTRHAEKATGRDPGLLPAGEARAARMAQRLKGANVAAVYATGFRRTQATAGPVAAANGLQIREYAAEANPETLVREWLRIHRGKTIFVVGHSNTIPHLVNALVGERRYADLEEGDYDKLFMVRVDAAGRNSVKVISTVR